MEHNRQNEQKSHLYWALYSFVLSIDILGTIDYNGLRTKDTAPNERKVNTMKFTAKGISDGWENTVEASEEFMRDEILWSIHNSEYEDLDEIIAEFADYVKEYTTEELNQIEDELIERQAELEAERERQAEAEEILWNEWKEELRYMNAEYLRSVRVA